MSEHMEWLKDQIKAEVQGKLDKAVKLLEELTDCNYAVGIATADIQAVMLAQKLLEVELFLESIKS